MEIEPEIKIEPPSSPTTTTNATTTSNETTPAAVEKEHLKPIKTKMVIKKTDVRQCRLCLRVLPPTDIQDAGTREPCSIREKILDAVGVRINADDKVRSVCTNCLLMVDMIEEFRMTCRKADLLHSTKLMMMHPGSWMSEENKTTLQMCHRLVKRNRAEMDGLFKCSRVGEGDIPKVSEGNRKKVVLKKRKVKKEKTSDSEERTAGQCRRKRRKVTPEKIVCDICGMLVRKDNLEYHRNRHSGLRPYRCYQEGCEAAFHGNKAMLLHVIAVHEKDHQRYECKICHRMIKGLVGLQNHVRSQHSSKDKHPLKTKCPICEKMYYKNFIKDHMAMHAGNFPYECEFCDRKFAAKNNWLFHRKKYHQDELNAQQSSSADTAGQLRPDHQADGVSLFDDLVTFL